MLSTRVAMLVLAAPLAFAPAASAEPIIEGCWGAASASYCDPTLRVTPIQGDPSPTPVCAGTCTYVGVPTVEPVQERYEVCLDYTTPAGYPASDCYVDVYPVDTLLRAVETVEEEYEEIRCNMTC